MWNAGWDEGFERVGGCEGGWIKGKTRGEWGTEGYWFSDFV